jgi:hypothetical protein
MENIELAKDNHINLITTNMQGKKAADIYADFIFSEDGKKVLKCACGQTPVTNKYYPKTEQCRITLDKNKCNHCAHKDQCKPKFYKKKTALVISWKLAERAKQQRYMKSEELKKNMQGSETELSHYHLLSREDIMRIECRLGEN